VKADHPSAPVSGEVWAPAFVRVGFNVGPRRGTIVNVGPFIDMTAGWCWIDWYSGATPPVWARSCTTHRIRKAMVLISPENAIEHMTDAGLL